MSHKIMFVGNLGRDPEMRYTPNGKAVATFSVASNRAYNGKESVIWFRVTAWEKLAEVCNQYLTKGSGVMVEGTLRADESGKPRTYTRKDNGETGVSFEVTASKVTFTKGGGGWDQIVVLGNLGQDPELRTTSTGKTVCTLSVASNIGDRTTWLRVATWNGTAEACSKYLSKGRQVFVVGQLVAAENGSPRLFTRNDGTVGSNFEVNAQFVRFMGGADAADAVQEEDEGEAIPEFEMDPVTVGDYADEIPF